MTPPFSIWARPALTAKDDWLALVEEEDVKVGGVGCLVGSDDGASEPVVYLFKDGERKADGRSGKVVDVPFIAIVYDLICSGKLEADRWMFYVNAYAARYGQRTQAGERRGEGCRLLQPGSISQ